MSIFDEKPWATERVGTGPARTFDDFYTTAIDPGAIDWWREQQDWEAWDTGSLFKERPVVPNQFPWEKGIERVGVGKGSRVGRVPRAAFGRIPSWLKWSGGIGLSVGAIYLINKITAKDDAHNTIEGMPELGLASVQRKILTDFGSGWVNRVSARISKFFSKGGKPSLVATTESLIATPPPVASLKATGFSSGQIANLASEAKSTSLADFMSRLGVSFTDDPGVRKLAGASIFAKPGREPFTRRIMAELGIGDLEINRSYIVNDTPKALAEMFRSRGRNEIADLKTILELEPEAKKELRTPIAKKHIAEIKNLFTTSRDLERLSIEASEGINKIFAFHEAAELKNLKFLGEHPQGDFLTALFGMPTHKLAVVQEEYFARALGNQSAYKMQNRVRKITDSWFSGFDDAYNTEEGLRHKGLAGLLRRIITDFGSGYRGLMVGALMSTDDIAILLARKGQLDDLARYLQEVVIPRENEGYQTIEGMHPGNRGMATRIIRGNTPFGSKVDRLKVFAQWFGAAKDPVTGMVRSLVAGARREGVFIGSVRQMERRVGEEGLRTSARPVLEDGRIRTYIGIDYRDVYEGAKLSLGKTTLTAQEKKWALQRAVSHEFEEASRAVPLAQREVLRPGMTSEEFREGFKGLIKRYGVASHISAGVPIHELQRAAAADPKFYAFSKSIYAGEERIVTRALETAKRRGPLSPRYIKMERDYSRIARAIRGIETKQLPRIFEERRAARRLVLSSVELQGAQREVWSAAVSGGKKHLQPSGKHVTQLSRYGGGV